MIYLRAILSRSAFSEFFFANFIFFRQRQKHTRKVGPQPDKWRPVTELRSRQGRLHKVVDAFVRRFFNHNRHQSDSFWLKPSPRKSVYLFFFKPKTLISQRKRRLCWSANHGSFKIDWSDYWNFSNRFPRCRWQKVEIAKVSIAKGFCTSRFGSNQENRRR